MVKKIKSTKEIIRFCVQYCFDNLIDKVSYKEYKRVKKYNKHKIKW